jgi:murein DD-endopeptidase MepM/ murein hydrolase activator NlpD
MITLFRTFERDPINKRKQSWVIQILLLLIVGCTLWKGLHRTPSIAPDVYSYLTSLSTELVLECQVEGEQISPTGWADILALRSSLASEQQALTIHQIESGIPFEKITWKSASIQVQDEQVKLIKRRREILLTNRYYEPQRFEFPVQGKTWYQDTFGSDREGGARKHEGTDLFGAEGTPLVSVSSGRIEKLGWNRLGGERVGIRGEDGNYYYYAHLQSIEPSLEIGQEIKKGDRIGTMGHSGDALTTPDHLHFGIELPNGVWVNPYPFLYVWQNSSLQ